MKKRFALYGMFAAMAIFATACGDDSSSGPEEESSSSIEAEDESSSSVEEEGKSSAADKKSSSSEAKKGDSSSSEKTTSSSSAAVSSSSEISYEPSCIAKKDGNTIRVNVRIYTDARGEEIQIISLDYENLQLSQTSSFVTFGVTSCEEAKTQFGESLENCSLDDKTVDLVQKFPTKEYFENVFGTLENAENTICSNIMAEFTVDTTALNQKMLAAGKYGTFRDTRDAMLYRTIEIGNQTWMAQNLLYETESGSSCYGDPMPEGVINGNCLVYGRLYTWDAAKSACPTGWHLPTMDDFTKLAVNVDPDFDGTSESFDNGDKLKTEGWDDGSNEIGFSAVPGGIYNYGYSGMDDGAYFWSQTVDLGVFAMILRSDKGEIIQDVADEVELSVRCIKDDAPSQSVSSN